MALTDDVAAAYTKAAELFRVSPEALRSRSRLSRIVTARNALALAMRECGWPLQEIGYWLKRDHTTIIYGLGKAREKAEQSTDYASRVQVLAALLGLPPVTETPGE